ATTAPAPKRRSDRTASRRSTRLVVARLHPPRLGRIAVRQIRLPHPELLWRDTARAQTRADADERVLVLFPVGDLVTLGDGAEPAGEVLELAAGLHVRRRVVAHLIAVR